MATEVLLATDCHHQKSVVEESLRLPLFGFASVPP
jgi:hypothetical protein